MKIAIVGSRAFTDLQQVYDFVDSLELEDVVISGGALGVDRAAAIWARARGLKVLEHIPDWDKHGKKAGYLRNELIVTDAELVVAFWDGTSAGTKHAINIAKRLKRRCVVVTGHEDCG